MIKLCSRDSKGPVGPLESLLHVKSNEIMNNEWQEERQLGRQNEQRFDEVLFRTISKCWRGVQQVSSQVYLLHMAALGVKNTLQGLINIFVKSL